MNRIGSVSLCCLAAAFFFAIASVTASAQTSPTRPLTIEAIYQPGGLEGRGPENLEWSPDGAKLSYVLRDASGEKGELWYVDADTGGKKLLVSADKLANLVPDVEKLKNPRQKEWLTRYHVAAYIWSPDSKHLLFDSLGQLWLFDIASQTAVQFTSALDPSEYPSFSPDGKHVAYVRKHNLFVRAPSGDREKQLTRGSSDNLLNGDIDWLYAEELGVRCNYFWSPDSKQIVFLHMDETKVPSYPIANLLLLHPAVDEQKYPEVGDPNPLVKLGVVNASGGDVRWISLPNSEDSYIPRFGWVRDGVIWAALLNRAQNKMDLFFIDAKTGKSRIVFTENTPVSWIEFEHTHITFVKRAGAFIWPSWRDGNMHLYLYKFDKENPLASEAKLERELDKGDYEVLEIKGVDETASTVFFEANKDDPRQTQIYSVQLDGSGFKPLTTDEGLHTAKFSEDGTHFTYTYQGPRVAPRSFVCASAANCKLMWQGNDEIAEYGLRAPSYLEFKADDGTTLYGRLLLPPQPPASGKIPVIVDIYGGPAAQTVLKGVPDPFSEILARKGFAIFSVDNRGTPGRDRKFQAAIRHEFGAIELKDQLTALDQLLARYPQLDNSRVGIWGWSNGGSMTLYAMTHSDRFRAGVAVAPVTNARNYDSIYMERYYGLPSDDKQGYEEADVTAAAGKLHGALLLVHGTDDDNVHFANSVQMADALVKADKQFHFMIYPGAHSISGTNVRVHLFTMIEQHFERELK